MGIDGEWTPDQENLCSFIIDDPNGSELSGLGTSWTIEISIAGGPFVPGAGIKAEIANGWYTYLATAGEAASDEPGPRSIKVKHPSSRQQNLEYVVKPRDPNAVEVTYTVIDTFTSLGLANVRCWITADAINSETPFFSGYTDFSGLLLDADGNLPRLSVGEMYVWKHLPSHKDDQNPHVIDTSLNTVFQGTMTPYLASETGGNGGAEKPFYAFATPDDFQKYWFMDFGDGQEHEDLWPLLRMAGSRVTAVLAASDQLNCPRSSWAEDYLKELVIIIAGVMFNSPAVHISNDQREIYSLYASQALDNVRTGNIQVCEGATGKEYPAWSHARYGLTERNTARVVASERY